MAVARTPAVLLATTAALLAVYVGSAVRAATGDRADALDSPAVRDRARAACAELRVDLDARPPLTAPSSPDARRARIAEQDAAVGRLVAAVRSAGPAALSADEPAERWLADWEALAAARRDWARTATGPFVAPQDAAGLPPPERMSRVGVAECVVPQSLRSAP